MKKIILFSILVLILGVACSSVSAESSVLDSKDYKTKTIDKISDLGTVTIRSSSYYIHNDNSPVAGVPPRPYAKSSGFTKNGGIETKKNIIKTKNVKGVNKAYTFETEYYLPLGWKNELKKWHNAQSIAMDGKYLYTIIFSKDLKTSKGFVARYDLNVLKKYKNDLGLLRQTGQASAYNRQLSGKQKIIANAIKKGPNLAVGHGQTLSYDPKTKHLWLSEYVDAKRSSTEIQTLTKISPNTLKPVEKYQFKLKLQNGKTIPPRSLLNFDKDGNFYYTLERNDYKDGLRVLKGTFNSDYSKVEVTDMGTITHGKPGEHYQSISINNVKDRFYLISDSIIYSFPLSKLKSQTLTKNDFEYTVFDTKREFEGMTFDSAGKEYLLLVNGPEVLKAK